MELSFQHKSEKPAPYDFGSVARYGVLGLVLFPHVYFVWWATSPLSAEINNYFTCMLYFLFYYHTNVKTYGLFKFSSSM